MIYTDWSELVALNKTGKPIALGGYPRGGTTFAYRCLGALVRQPWHLEEYFHIFYEFKKNKLGEVVIDTDAIEDKKQQGVTINPPKDGTWYKELDRRYHMIRDQHSWDKVYIKVLPFHARDLKTTSPNYYRDLMRNNWWIHVLREDYVNMILSNLYSNNFNRFHYYGDQPLPDKPFTTWINDVDLIYKQQFLLLYQQWQDSNECGVFVPAESITHLKEPVSDRPVVSQEISNLIRAGRQRTRAPRLDKNKPDLFRKIIINYDETVDRIRSMVQQVERETDGFFTFTDTQVKVNA